LKRGTLTPLLRGVRGDNIKYPLNKKYLKFDLGVIG